MMMTNKQISPLTHIIVKGARENNLKNLSVNIPKNQLVVLTGLSGSGKSSLAFDTIYAEGQRRYLDSLSSYARQFLHNSDKPDVDNIEGLAPAISIDQKSTSHNPRSTVGTVTEIYDYLRLLYARVGTPTCPYNHGPISHMSINQMVEQVWNLAVGTKLQILSPVARSAKGTFKKDFERLKQAGYVRVLVDGQTYHLDQVIELNKTHKHNIDIVVERISSLQHDQSTRSRIYAAIELACKESGGAVNVQYLLNEQVHTLSFSQARACQVCGFCLPELEPRLFSFNSPIGACSTCNGLGFTYEPDPNKIFLNPNLSIYDGGIDYFKNTVNTSSIDWQRFEHIIKHYNISLYTPIKDLSEQEIKWLLTGSDQPIDVRIISANGKKFEFCDYLEGIGTLIKRRHQETQSEGARDFYTKYMSETPCHDCLGQKLSLQARSVLINDLNIIAFTQLNIKQAFSLMGNLNLSPTQLQVGHLVIQEITNRLNFLINVGLDYLNLARNAASLSGGELQRIRLASQLGSSLTGVLYVLDEPSIGLHPRDNTRLINTMKKMRDLGNSVLVVEHDEETMLAADWLIEVGPKAGTDGGEIVVAGTAAAIQNHPTSITGHYLAKRWQIPANVNPRKGNGKKLVVTNAAGNNLKNITVEFPLNKLVAVTGVSGSGKSTLVNHILVKALKKRLGTYYDPPLKYGKLIGYEHVDKLIEVSQDPIGRTPRSNPATYVGVFDDIRELYALLPEARARGYLKGRFSFNVKGGRCEKCQGEGEIKIEMHFLPDVYIVCDECQGKKYNQETLSVLFKNKSIYDVLAMTISEAAEFFSHVPNIFHKLDLLVRVGLGYLQLGANANYISGGEAQRIKLAKHLQKKARGHALFVLDEPTTGLHTHDIANLLAILQQIVDQGDSVIVIEHNLELIKAADYIIDLGPEGGEHGGNVIICGSPQELVNANTLSYTAQFLKPYFEK